MKLYIQGFESERLLFTRWNIPTVASYYLIHFLVSFGAFSVHLTDLNWAFSVSQYAEELKHGWYL